MEPIKVKNLANLGTMCPSQWEGVTEDGREIFVRYRWGLIRVYLDDEVMFEKQITDGADGFMTDPQMEKALDGILVLPVGFDNFDRQLKEMEKAHEQAKTK